MKQPSRQPLGQSIQNIVTEDEETAKDLIAYLKKNKFGRATFLPLTNITYSKTLHNHKCIKGNRGYRYCQSIG